MNLNTLNLNTLASTLVASVQPRQKILWLQASQYGSTSSGQRYPVYSPVFISASIQAVSEDRMLALSLPSGASFQQGRLKIVYLNGHGQPLNRCFCQGNDRFVFDGVLWQVVQVMEDWGGGAAYMKERRNGGWSQVLVRMMYALQIG